MLPGKILRSGYLPRTPGPPASGKENQILAADDARRGDNQSLKLFFPSQMANRLREGFRSRILLRFPIYCQSALKPSH